MLRDGKIGVDAVVVARPDTPYRLVEQAVTAPHLQQGPVPAGSDQHVVDAAGDSGRYFTGPQERVSALNVKPSSSGRTVSHAS